MLLLNAVNNSELLAFTVVDNNCPNKSPPIVFKSGVISFASRFPFKLIVEFSLPLTIPAIGAIFFSISNCVKDSLISTPFKPNTIANVGILFLVETEPFAVIKPLKILVFTFCKVTVSFLTKSVPETFFKFKLS